MKDVDAVGPITTKPIEDSNIDKTGTLSQNTLTVNKIFVVNTLKQVDDHNRIKTNQDSKLLRKFQNEQRKKLTLKNLNRFSAGKTLYSDLIFVAPERKKGKHVKRMNLITPLEQVKKLVADAADFDETHEKIMKRLVHKPLVSVDKTLLKNHLRHTSVHNRLREETEMWDQYESQEEKKKKNGLQTQRSKPFRSGLVGGMYSDREPGKVKVTRVKSTPDEPPAPLFGAATRKLLDLEESMPDRWGHSGFKETYENELRKPSAICRKRKLSREVIISNSLSDRLNSSIELSDDELEIITRNKRNKHKAVNKLKRSLKVNLRMITVNKAIRVENEIPIKKKSVITIAPKSNNIKLVTKQKRGKLERVSGKKVLVKRNNGTLQSDMIIAAEKRQMRNIKRDVSPMWEHDGFQEIVDDDDDDSEEEEGESDDISIRKSAKSRLGVLNLSDDNSDDDSDSLKMKSQRRKIFAVKNKIKQRSKFKNVICDKVNSESDSPVQVSDSEEWTEKEVNRVMLKNSIHEEKRKSVKSRLGQKRTIDNSKSSSRVNRKRISHNDSGDSSFTDSSGDERYKKRIDVRKKRDQRFSNYQNR